ncbi:MAG: hypothetical protein M9911_12565 [Saprospiraceae bacterium]|nr:hypothetical protein [Saprospiraceae bacterium]
MKYNLVENLGLINWQSRIITYKNDTDTIYQIRLNYDYSVWCEENFGEKRFAVHYYNDVIILSDLKDYHVVIDLSRYIFFVQKGNKYTINVFDDTELKYSPSIKEYTLYKKNRIVNTILKQSDLEYLLIFPYLLEYKKGEKKSQVYSRSIRNNDIIWTILLNGEIINSVQYETFVIIDLIGYNSVSTDSDNVVKSDWSHPSYRTICLNYETGVKLWQIDGKLIKIDNLLGSVLISSKNILEIKISNGEIISNINLPFDDNEGSLPHFADKDCIYYLTNDHSFGKINKITGEIQWEFQLLDEKGQKRMLSNWLLLGNGNLVLQTMPNHPNGDFTCIFNPEENLEYSKVKDGIRIPPPHA